ncbi:hypothetical protein NQ011_09330 [Corynebacterium phoceense]|uniref:DUF6779 domain-containing protein n=1 Tax=Corynebacterium phoceense TaxID=1686286 RepID=UPI00211B8D41|nr:DUF6779 domain-containing protein [Corynebacterium phoceense]MCQ9336884.1 hypothetical protein [Corynebacterium phoceense]
MTSTQQQEFPDKDGAQSAPESETATTRANWALIALVVLAVVATILMLLSGSAAAMKLALVAALWAAVLGFFLVTRYRREAAQREQELILREELYTTELDKLRAEKSALEGTAPGDSELLADIKNELQQIRTQLEELSGRDFTYEPAALYAEARRIAEIEYKIGATEEPKVAFTQSSAGAPSADAIAGRVGTQPSASVRHDNPLSELIREREAAGSDTPARGHGAHEAPETAASSASAPQADTASKPQAASAAASTSEQTPHAPTFSTQRSPESTFSTGSFQAVRWDQGGVDTNVTPKASHTAHSAATKAEPATAQDAGQDSAQDAKKAEAAASEGSRGRRRSDAGREGAVSVAELMAQMKKGK